MPKLSSYDPVEDINDSEIVIGIREVSPGVYATVTIPLSVVMAQLDGASFDNIAGTPGENAALAAVLDALAPKANPALTGTPTAPTAAGGTNTAQIATTAFVKAAIDALADAAPGALDTLNELAAALGDDPNFAATMTAALAAKADAASVTASLAAKASLTGAETLENKRITKRVVPAGSTSGGMTPNANTTDTFKATGLTGNVTINAPSGTKTDEQQLIIHLDDNGTSRTISWNTGANGFRVAKNVTLPTATTAGKWIRVCCIWNSADSRWDVVTVVEQA